LEETTLFSLAIKAIERPRTKKKRASRNRKKNRARQREETQQNREKENTQKKTEKTQSKKPRKPTLTSPSPQIPPANRKKEEPKQQAVTFIIIETKEKQKGAIIH
jgi:hypothetical protein